MENQNNTITQTNGWFNADPDCSFEYKEYKMKDEIFGYKYNLNLILSNIEKDFDKSCLGDKIAIVMYKQLHKNILETNDLQNLKDDIYNIDKVYSAYIMNMPYREYNDNVNTKYDVLFNTFMGLYDLYCEQQELNIIKDEEEVVNVVNNVNNVEEEKIYDNVDSVIEALEQGKTLKIYNSIYNDNRTFYMIGENLSEQGINSYSYAHVYSSMSIKEVIQNIFAYNNGCYFNEYKNEK